MGGLLIKNPELRCKTCFSLYSIKIKPDFPTCKISKTCKCSTTEQEIQKFLTEYKKNKNLSIACSQCKKSNPKEPKYCHECKQLFCINCAKATHNEKNNNKDHKLIVIEKYDFFCISHQNDNFCAYCKTCKMDICIKCGSEKLHNGHKILLYHKIYDEKKMREYLKKAIKSAEVKIDYNKKICQMITKELKSKELVKRIRTLNDISEDENKKILELINILYEIYDINKTKNYAIITNMIDNMNFNFDRIQFEKNTTKEKDAQSLEVYFKSDFVLKVEGKPKEQLPMTLEEQMTTDGFVNLERSDSTRKKIEGTPEGKKEENPEEKKEEEKKDEEKKDEEKKDEEKKDEEKKEEEKKEEEKENEEKKEEEKEEDDGHIKTMKERKEMIEKKFNEKGGIQSVEAVRNTNKNNDIINAPKGNPEDVMNIISNQTINKKVKKKPKKVNFQDE